MLSKVRLMQRLILTFLSLMFYMLSFSQFKLQELKDTTNRTQFPTDTSILNVINKSKAAVLFRNYSAWSIWKEYKLISYQGDNKWHYNFLSHPDTSALFFEIAVPQDSISQLWESIETNNLFSITKENIDDPNCDAIIHDSHYYEFWIFFDDHYRRIRYYAPEYFEAECKSSSERRRIIETAKAFMAFINRYK